MCETSRSSWGEWTIRRAPIIGAVIGATLTLAVGLLSMAEIGVPVLVWLLYPAAILTWLFVYGDNGTHLQHAAMTVVIGTVLNAIVGNLLGRLVRVAFRRHFQVSLKAILLSTFWFSIAFAVGAACYRNRHDSWPIMCLISALVGAGVGALGRRSLAGSACGVLLYIAVPYLLFGLMRLADAWWDLRQALGWR